MGDKTVDLYNTFGFQKVNVIENHKFPFGASCKWGVGYIFCME